MPWWFRLYLEVDFAVTLPIYFVVFLWLAGQVRRR
jgi:hypothetical protein